MKLTDLISERSISVALASTEKRRVLAELSALLAGGARGVRADEIIQILEARERVATTGIGDGVALPHGKAPGLARAIAAIGISPDGIPFDAVDGAPVRIFAAILSPAAGDAGEHLRILAQLARVLRDPAFRRTLLAQRDAAGVTAAFTAAGTGGQP
jgi:PTS system nitrogen regulatory IIA component